MKKQNTAIGNRRVIEQTRIHEGRCHYKVFQKFCCYLCRCMFRSCV